VSCGVMVGFTDDTLVVELQLLGGELAMGTIRGAVAFIALAALLSLAQEGRGGMSMPLNQMAFFFFFSYIFSSPFFNSTFKIATYVASESSSASSILLISSYITWVPGAILMNMVVTGFLSH
jgi:hypothetical protein